MSVPEDYLRFLEIEGPEMEIVVERDTIEEGKSFSADALEALNNQMILWVGSRVMKAWTQRNEPPSRLKVIVTVEVA